MPDVTEGTPLNPGGGLSREAAPANQANIATTTQNGGSILNNNTIPRQLYYECRYCIQCDNLNIADKYVHNDNHTQQHPPRQTVDGTLLVLSLLLIPRQWWSR